MSSSNFSREAIARLERLADSDIAWYNAGCTVGSRRGRVHGGGEQEVGKV